MESYKEVHHKAAVRASLLSLFSHFLAGSWRDLKLIQRFKTSAISLLLIHLNQAKEIFRLYYDLNTSMQPIICSLLSYNKHGVLEVLFSSQITLRKNTRNIESRTYCQTESFQGKQRVFFELWLASWLDGCNLKKQGWSFCLWVSFEGVSHQSLALLFMCILHQK